MSHEAKRSYTRIAFNPLECKPGMGSMNPTPEGELKLINNPPKEDDTVIDLISGLLPEKVEEILSCALDDLCPELVTTPKLQDKALRLVFSVGVDVVMLDAESSAYVGKLNLEPKDMLSSDTTEEVFGSFIIPKKSNDI